MTETFPKKTWHFSTFSYGVRKTFDHLLQRSWRGCQNCNPPVWRNIFTFLEKWWVFHPIPPLNDVFLGIKLKGFRQVCENCILWSIQSFWMQIGFLETLKNFRFLEIEPKTFHLWRKTFKFSTCFRTMNKKLLAICQNLVERVVTIAFWVSLGNSLPFLFLKKITIFWRTRGKIFPFGRKLIVAVVKTRIYVSIATFWWQKTILRKYDFFLQHLRTSNDPSLVFCWNFGWVVKNAIYASVGTFLWQSILLI